MAFPLGIVRQKREDRDVDDFDGWKSDCHRMADLGRTSCKMIGIFLDKGDHDLCICTLHGDRWPVFFISLACYQLGM
jgi:hypothetical protein